MSTFKVKQAIDEVIGDKPLLNDTFVHKVLNNKKQKTVQWLQPTIVLVCIVVIAFALYVIPSNNKQTASIIQGESSLLTVHQQEMVQTYFEAIQNKDPEALVQVSILDSEWLFEKYESINLGEPIKIIRTLDFDNYMSIFVKLMSFDGTPLVNKLTYNKMNHRIETVWDEAFTQYEVPEFPKKIILDYSIAAFFSYMNETDLLQTENYQEPLKLSNGMTIHFLKLKHYMQVLETADQQYIYLNSTFLNNQTFDYIPYGEDVFLKNKESGYIALIHKHSNGEYQVDIGMADFENEIEPYLEDITTGKRFILFETDTTCLSIVKNGELLFVDLKNQANLKMPYELYSIKATENQEIVFSYQDDDIETSTTYVLDENYNLIQMDK